MFIFFFYVYNDINIYKFKLNKEFRSEKENFMFRISINHK